MTCIMRPLREPLARTRFENFRPPETHPSHGAVWRFMLGLVGADCAEGAPETKQIASQTSGGDRTGEPSENQKRRPEKLARNWPEKFGTGRGQEQELHTHGGQEQKVAYDPAPPEVQARLNVSFKTVQAFRPARRELQDRSGVQARLNLSLGIVQAFRPA